MKKIELFGRRLTIGFEKKEKMKKEIKDIEYSAKEVVSEKIVYLIFILVITVVSANLYLFNGNLRLGDVAIRDIVAPTDIIYNDKEAKDRIISEIIENSKKEYISVEKVEEETIQRVKVFFQQLKKEKKIELQMAHENIKTSFDVEISEELFTYLFEKSDKELDFLRDKYLDDINILYEKGVKKDRNLLRLNSLFEKMENLDSNEEKFIKFFIKPNYILDTEKTKELLSEKIEQVNNVSVRINAGSVILKKGEAVSENKVIILKNAGLYGKTSKIIKFMGTFIYLLILSIVFKNICMKFLFDEIRKKSYYSAIMLSLAVGIISFRVIDPNWKYILPIETVFILLGILINVKTSLIIGGFLILYGVPLNGFGVEYLVIEIFSLIVSLYLITKIKNRTNIINTGIYIGMTKVFIVLTIAVGMNMEFLDSLIKSGILFLSGAFTGMLTIALLPYFERTFNILTDIKLLELGDLSQPLLRRLSVNAPGTFHHSMMVATLSEQATEAIGGNHVFARVASYYHDIGKMKRPQFYVENQADGVNPHNNLTPTLSTLIITSHTRDGDEMGREYNLPKEIRDIMYEHQGTTLLAYFYNKAKQSNPYLEESDFRYSGPKPRSKESAVIMLADSIEAAVRSLDEKTPVTIEKMLRKIIGSKIEEQQLSDADLTFKEIEIIIKSFTKILMSIHHVRIKYPGQK
ncbi:MAG: HDIG domain-containing metalloprotein [Psychrilyobacter sp.]|uniref:HD family phosphohydrolase n=1 Tax=Psychrilyobacter sp. TaxID=2586924 RepID=UPI003C7240DB